MSEPTESPRTTSAQLTPLIAIMAICICVEGIVSLADFGVIDPSRLRSIVYDNAGFWPGLLGDWRPNYSGQSALMFLTYGFLHGGLVHLAINMFTLNSLGRPVIERAGPLGFVEIYAAALLGGAIVYGMLAAGLRPMVGASGALFGLAGALVAWNLKDRISLSEELAPLLRIVALLLAINLVMWWALGGQLAWQTHLGGFLAGFAVAFWGRSDPMPD